MTRVGVIARADLTGLGVQSRNWVRLLNPDKTIVINSQPFNRNEQHFEWYQGRKNAYRVDGFIKPHEINRVLDGVDVLLTFEIPYNYELIRVAKARGVKIVLQNNWEFTDYLQQPSLPLPDLLVNHSYWYLDKQRELWPDITEYCATPVFVEDYEEIYKQNLARNGKKRFLHIAGRKTYQDRNGTQDLLQAVKLIPKDVDFELVIKTQTTEVNNTDDPRVTIDTSTPLDEKELYKDFDAMILPRRYGGACLPMGEALASGLPVIMTDIDPNNKVLPKDWLVAATLKTSFMARTTIDVFSAQHQDLARKITDLKLDKQKAREIAVKEYSPEVIKHKWYLLLSKIGL